MNCLTDTIASAVLRRGVQRSCYGFDCRPASRGTGVSCPVCLGSFSVAENQRPLVAHNTLATLQARLSAEFGKLVSPEGLTKSIDRHNAMLFRRRLVDFLASVRGFIMVK